MKRIFSTAILTAMGALAASAGTLTPVVLNPKSSSGPNQVLNNALAAGFIPCASPTVGNNCNARTIATPPPSGATTFSSYSATGGSAIQSVPFDLGTYSSTGSVNDIWVPGGANQTPSVTMDVGSYTGSNSTAGIFGATDVWTMINDWYATPGYQGITITLSGVAADGSTAISEAIQLTAGVDYRSIAAGGAQASGTTPTDNATPCDVANIGTAILGSASSACNGRTPSATAAVGVDNGTWSGAPSNPAGVTITVYNDIYTSKDNQTTPVSYWLDAQDIFLGGSSPFDTGYLDTITLSAIDGTTGCGTTTSGCVIEKPILSAVTVQSGSLTSTPEPATMFLLLSGLAGMSVWRIRRVRS